MVIFKQLCRNFNSDLFFLMASYHKLEHQMYFHVYSFISFFGPLWSLYLMLGDRLGPSVGSSTILLKHPVGSCSTISLMFSTSRLRWWCSSSYCFIHLFEKIKNLTVGNLIHDCSQHTKHLVRPGCLPYSVSI